MPSSITKKQKLILDFIAQFSEEHNYSPSYREIAAGLGLSSVASVAGHINNLVHIGALRKVPGAARSLEVIDLSYPETTALFRFRLTTATPDEAAILSNAAAILGLDLSDSLTEPPADSAD